METERRGRKESGAFLSCGGCGGVRGSEVACRYCGSLGAGIGMSGKSAGHLRDRYDGDQAQRALWDEERRAYVAEHGAKAWAEKVRDDVAIL